MELCRGNLSRNSVPPIFTHYGTALAGAQRIESLFATRTPRVYDGSRFVTLDYYRQPLSYQPLNEAIEHFIDHCKRSEIRTYHVDFRRPFKLIDCWMDDPIGSAGLEAISPENNLSAEDVKSLETLFHPFMQIVFPQNVMLELSDEKVSKLFDQRALEPLFQQEWKRRQNRSLALGEDFRMAARHEIVWLDLSIKLREWVLERGYDSFVYQNDNEHNGSTSFIALRDDQVIDAEKTLSFNETKYRNKVASKFKRFLDKLHSKPPQSEYYDVFWGGQNPLDFWKPTIK